MENRHRTLKRRLNLTPDRTSQRGRLLEFLSRDGSSGLRDYIWSAIEMCYLVQALSEQGVREREDLNAIAARCCARLRKQIEDIETLMGVQYEEGHSSRPRWLTSNQVMVSDQEASASSPSQPSTSESDDEDDDEDDEDEDEEDNMLSFDDGENPEDWDVEPMTAEEFHSMINSATDG